MNTQLNKRQMPEERELDKKRAELATLEAELAERELELATLQATLHAFEDRYLRQVGALYAELDEINAQIAEAKARLHSHDQQAQQAADKARAQANESAQDTAAVQEETPQAKFQPSDELKKLYRELARQLHPDLSRDPQDRERRHQLMVEVNRAYESSDLERLRAIQLQWQRSPESIKDESVGAELVRIIRQIAQVEERIAAIEAEIEELIESDLHQLYVRTEEAEDESRDLLQEMASEIREKIAETKANGFDVLAELFFQHEKSGTRNWRATQ